MLEFVDKHTAFRRELAHGDDLIDGSTRDNRQPADLKRGNKEAVGLLRRHLRRREDGDLPAGLLDRIVQHEIFACEFADKADENRQLDFIEVQRHASR